MGYELEQINRAQTASEVDRFTEGLGTNDVVTARQLIAKWS